MPKLSYQNRRYTITLYDPDWKKNFENEVKIIQPIFAGKALQIEHIGSTSVPGLAGKPTIDILVLVNDVSEIDGLNKKMEDIGYKVLGEYVMPGAQLFVKEKNDVRLVNLHVFQKDHSHVKEMLQLRDYLRVHPEDVKEYSDLKFELAEKYPNDYAQYRKYKDEYMERLKDKVRKSFS
ncbi:MAG: GrpB family protein [Patescibacteria group bacterium]|jgi:GrpB-like predicted nucleotidyltransferase (UPF0157 family)